MKLALSAVDANCGLDQIDGPIDLVGHDWVRD